MDRIECDYVAECISITSNYQDYTAVNYHWKLLFNIFSEKKKRKCLLRLISYFSPPPECDSPSGLKGKSIKRLRIIKELECRWSTPSIEIIPDQNQVVFAGDTMTLKCRAPSITNDKTARLDWLWNSNITADISELDLYGNPQNNFNDIKIENKHLDDSGIVAR